MKDYPFINKNGKQRPQSKEWSDIRAEIMQLKTELNLNDAEFRALSAYEDHQGIEETIYQTFCQFEDRRSRPTWLWLSFKQEVYSTDFLPEVPESYLHTLIDPTETIWLGALDSMQERSKIWFYEGQILPIQKILFETQFFDEFYLVSKKYEWLICINHHDTLIATGGEMPKRLKTLCGSLRG
ncbi:DUF6756 family protein [Psychrobacter pygoscelis]|uniref:DUF6756 family protein n=1 Tax=Psychrobacter pygoscelis TaxID=2488563 RepID=UPI00103E1D98|nr:DUF6756 family protein [Psychrobacter pygoscelis]